MKQATVFTHRQPRQTADAVRLLCDAATEAGWLLRFSPEETRKHHLTACEGLLLDADLSLDVDLCLVLGGDGTILHALRTYTGAEVPVFGINYGEVGFLATVDPDGLETEVKRAFSGDYEVLSLPAVEVRTGEEDRWIGINDISIHRQQGMRVADLSYMVGDEEVGRVRCDGLVVATPAGSTGYNLANGGPVMAWGVEGMAVSFIAPHSLTARALVVAPQDPLTVHNRSREEPVDVTVDGRPVCVLGPGESILVRMPRDLRGLLAQLPGASFYHRLRYKFGRLASVGA